MDGAPSTPLNACCTCTALRQGTDHPKTRVMDMWCPLHRLAPSQSQSCCLKFSSGQTVNRVVCGMCLELLAGRVPELWQGDPRLGWEQLSSGSPAGTLGVVPPVPWQVHVPPVYPFQTAHPTAVLGCCSPCWLLVAIFPGPWAINQHFLLCLEMSFPRALWIFFIAYFELLHFRLWSVWILLLSSLAPLLGLVPPHISQAHSRPFIKGINQDVGQT